MARKYTPTLGSISHGTLRTEDLLEAFLDELCAVAPRKHGQLKREARKAQRGLSSDGSYPNGQDAEDIVNDLMDALSEHAPPFMYFGNDECDGTSFGWWPCWEQIDELDQFEHTGKATEANHKSEFKVVSDHGNVEIYIRFANGRIKSLLGIV